MGEEDESIEERTKAREVESVCARERDRRKELGLEGGERGGEKERKKKEERGSEISKLL